MKEAVRVEEIFADGCSGERVPPTDVVQNGEGLRLSGEVQMVDVGNELIGDVLYPVPDLGDGLAGGHVYPIIVPRNALEEFANAVEYAPLNAVMVMDGEVEDFPLNAVLDDKDEGENTLAFVSTGCLTDVLGFLVPHKTLS
jgi:hypothetical protein